MSVKRNINVKAIRIAQNAEIKTPNHSFSDLVIDAHNQFTAEKREFLDELFFTIRSTDYEIIDGGIYMHLVRYEKNGSTGIVPKVTANQNKAPIDEKKSPKDGDFLNDDCFLYIYKNTAFFISNGLSLSKAQIFLNDLLTKAKLLDTSEKILMADMPNHEVLAHIKKYGVKRIRMKTLMDSGTWLASRQLSKGTEKIDELTFSILEFFKSYSPENADELCYELIINNKGNLEDNPMDALTIATLDFYDHQDQDYEFFIDLDNGEQIIPGNKIKLKKENAPINRKANTLDKDHVIKTFKAYKEELAQKGIIAE